MRWKPLHDHIVVRYHEPEEWRSPSGLVGINPDTTAPRSAEVLAIGPGRWSVTCGKYSEPTIGVEVGSTVLIRGGMQGRKVETPDGDVYFIIPEELMGVE